MQGSRYFAVPGQAKALASVVLDQTVRRFPTLLTEELRLRDSRRAGCFACAFCVSSLSGQSGGRNTRQSSEFVVVGCVPRYPDSPDSRALRINQNDSACCGDDGMRR